jgi:hypothetical protein
MERYAIVRRRVGSLVALQQQVFGVVGYGVDDLEKEGEAGVVFARVSSRVVGMGVVDGLLDY